MKRVFGCLGAVAVGLVVFSAGGTVLADTAVIEKMSYPNVTVKLQDGKVVISGAGRDTSYDLGKVDSLIIERQDRFNDAEAAMTAGDYKKAAVAYGDAIGKINAKEVKLLAKARAIKACDEDGRWVEAVRYFLEVYASAPNASIWALRPAKMPEGGSKLLGESANMVSLKVNDPAFKAADAQKNLKVWLLEIYTKANDSRATALAQQLSGTSDAVQEKPAEAAGSAVSIDLGGIDAAFAAKKYEDVVRIADAALDHGAVGEGAVKLFMVKGDALKALGKNDEACLAYLRIAAHYPANGQCATALLAAANLEKEKQPDAAKALYMDIVRKYPHSLQAAEAKKNIPASSAQP